MSELHYDGGGPALRDMIAGKADMMFEPMSASIGPLRKNTLRALAVTTAECSETLPELPLMSDTLPGYRGELSDWHRRAAWHTERGLIDILNKAVIAAYADPKMRARLSHTGGEPLPGPPDAFGKIFAGEIEKWGKVVKSSPV